ncbi:2-oxo acid dehydrogenase subunit E2 [bacterium]|nr:2-oxo acid dehydrogenase subunit E2 [bacterium]
MASPIQLLQLSPTMSEGTIVKWHVKEGDRVSAGDVLAEIETDKAVMEQEAFDDGTVLKLMASEGQAVPVGQEIAVIGEEGEDVSDIKPSPTEKKEKEPAPKQDDEQPIVKQSKAPEVDLRRAPEPAKETPKPAAKSDNGRIVASPLARKMADDHGLDLSAIDGSGPNSRIVKRDIEAALGSGSAKAAAKAPAPSFAAAIGGEDEEIALSGMRKTIARRLVYSRQEVPAFNLTVEVDAEPLEKAVAVVRERYPESKVTLTHFIIKAVAATCMQHPWVRTQWIDGKLIRKNTADISVAVAIEDGLLTPVIRNANMKGVIALAQELRELAGRARERKLGEEDLTGGVQTISNLGMFGIDNFDAIMNPPESSILAIGAAIEKPVVRNGELTVGKVFTVTMGCDHRVVDGAVGASYLQDLKAALQDPLLMLV